MTQKQTFYWFIVLIGISLMLTISTGSTHFVNADDASSTPSSTTDTSTPTTSTTTNDTSSTASSTPIQTNTATSSDSTTTTSTATSTPLDLSADATSTPQQQSQVATSTNGTGGTATTTGGVIGTGDATATTSVDNELNTNTTNPDQPGESNSSTITASSTNTGELLSTASSTATTGDNSVSGGDSSSTIATGDAIATANVINVVNTNLFNSNGLVLFLNQLFGGGIDLNQYDLSYFFNGGPGASAAPNAGTGSQPCTILTCLNSSQVNVFNINTATVTNSVLVHASTGDNSASSTGDGIIQTGNAYAAANVLNLVNTNLVNSGYLLISFNNFGNLLKDIVLPGAPFFEQLFSQGGALPQLNSSTYTTNNTNDGTTTASTTADAVTGDNTASSTATSTGDITSGNAYSSASTFTQENTNLFGGASVFMLFRVWGNWTGTVEGLPPGILWQQTPDGVELVSANSTSTSSSTPQGDTCQYANNTLVGGPCFNSSSFLASSTNTASLNNDVHVYALTGQNQATSTDGTSTITSGDAYAAANVVNMVNTNVIGRNWIFAIFNIFGNWSGNIAFGEPDLWVGAVAQTSNPTPPNSDVTYVFTVTNHGLVDATNVMLKADFNKNALSFTDPSASSTDTGVVWNLGTIPQGQSRDFSFTGHVADIPSGTTLSVPVTATVSEDQHDSNPTDNTEQVTIVVSSPALGGTGGGGGGIFFSNNTWTPNPNISIVKTASIGTTTSSSSVDYKVVIDNADNAGPLYDGLLTDTITDPSGGVMYTNTWNLDTVEPGDEITLTYSVAYASSTLPGTYHNTAVVTGLENSPSTLSGGSAISPINATRDVVLLPTGLVLGTSTEATSSLADPSSCTPLLINYLRPGKRNNPQDVWKLQQFLNITQTANLPVTGFFGTLTTMAVKNFQRTYANDILVPADTSTPTGLVYAMTLQKINAISCSASISIDVPALPFPRAHTSKTIGKYIKQKKQTSLSQKKVPSSSATSKNNQQLLGNGISSLIH